MKIGFVLDDTLDRTDGVQQYVLTLGRWLSGRGHEVHYVVAKTKRRDVPNVHSLGRLASVNFNGNRVRTPLPGSGRRVRRVIARLNLDVLHVQLPYSPAFGGQAILAAGPRTAVVGTFHILPAGRLAAGLNRVLGRRLRRSADRIEAVMAVSKAAAEFARAVYGWPAGVVPCPIDVKGLAAAGARAKLARENMGRGRRRLRVVFLGRLVRRKGAGWLVKAFAVLPPTAAKQVRLVIGGGGPLARRLRRAAKGMAAITFTGVVPERAKAKFLAAADIAVFPATGGESFGIVVAEAIAAGAGVVLGGDNPGYASVLGEDSPALFEPTDTAGFSRRLAYFALDNLARKKLHDAQQRLVKKYDIELVGRQIEKLYRQAVRQRRG